MACEQEYQDWVTAVAAYNQSYSDWQTLDAAAIVAEGEADEARDDADVAYSQQLQDEAFADNAESIYNQCVGGQFQGEQTEPQGPSVQEQAEHARKMLCLRRDLLAKRLASLEGKIRKLTS